MNFGRIYKQAKDESWIKPEIFSWILFTESDEGLHFVPKDQYIIDRESVREFFVFADGVVVFWGMENAEVTC